MRVPDHVLRDLARKAADDVSERVKMTARLVSDPRDMFAIALSACGSAIGLSAGFSDMAIQASSGDVLSPDKQVDLMWAILRPIALSALGGSDADFRELLSHCER